MSGTVSNTFLYPIKGMAGIETPEAGLLVDPRVGVRGDRNRAVYRGDGDLPVTWQPKNQFFVAMNTEGVAIEHEVSEADLDDDGGLPAARIEQMMAQADLGGEGHRLVATGGRWHLTDTPKPCVSFLNLASVRALGEFMGATVDPRRFRMNVWVDGLEPWVELDYVLGFESGAAYPMQAGGLRLHIDDLCERCRATHQNPATGRWDLEVLAGLRECLSARGYRGSPQRGRLEVMGWLAIPSSAGRISNGQTVQLD